MTDTAYTFEHIRADDLNVGDTILTEDGERLRLDVVEHRANKVVVQGPVDKRFSIPSLTSVVRVA